MNKESLEEIFKDVDENKKKIVRTMFDDFIHEAEQLEDLKPKMKEIGTPKNSSEAKRLKFYSKMYSDISQRHDSKIKIFLSTLNKFEGAEENPISAWLRERQND